MNCYFCYLLPVCCDSYFCYLLPVCCDNPYMCVCILLWCVSMKYEPIKYDWLLFDTFVTLIWFIDLLNITVIDYRGLFMH